MQRMIFFSLLDLDAALVRLSLGSAIRLPTTRWM